MTTQPVDVNIRMNGVDRSARAVRSATNNVRALRNQMGRSNGILVRNRRMFQQLGFQVADFSTQIAGGQSAMLAFTQQGGQMLQFFGPVGAIMAGLVAVFGSLFIAMSKSGMAFSELGKFTGVLRDNFAALAKFVEPVKEFAWAIANLLVNNIDRALVVAGTMAAFFAGKWVIGFLAARLSVTALTAAVVRLGATLMRFLPIAALIALGELVFVFVKLTKATGSWGEAMGLFKNVFVQVMVRIKESLLLFVETVALASVSIENEFRRLVVTVGDMWLNLMDSIAGTMSKIPGPLGLLGRTMKVAVLGAQEVLEEVGASIETIDSNIKVIAQSLRTSWADLWGTPVPALQEIRELLKGIDEDIDLREFFSGLGKDADDAKDKLSDVAQAFKAAFDGVFDAILDKSKSVSDVLRNLGRELLKIALRTQLFGFLSKSMPKIFGDDGPIPVGKFAKGSAFSGPVTPFAKGGVVSAPKTFPMANGMGLMGERGPEAVMPLTRTAGGQLGVKSEGGGANVNIQIVNNTGADIKRESTSDGEGNRLERFIIDTVGRGATSGELDTALSGRFGTKVARKRR